MSHSLCLASNVLTLNKKVNFSYSPFVLYFPNQCVLVLLFKISYQERECTPGVSVLCEKRQEGWTFQDSLITQQGHKTDKT